MRLSVVNRSSVILIIQCYWCLTRMTVESSRIGLTEDAKQLAFEQLLGKTGRLRMAGSSQTLLESTTTLPPTITSIAIPIMLSDEEAKRHDRRHAIHHQKKNNKKDHSKRQHHAGYYTFSSIWRKNVEKITTFIDLCSQIVKIVYALHVMTHFLRRKMSF